VRSGCLQRTLVSRGARAGRRHAAGALEAPAGWREVGANYCARPQRRSPSLVAQAQPDMVDRIMDAIEPSEWGPAVEKQLCYEIKVRLHATRCLLLL